MSYEQSLTGTVTCDACGATESIAYKTTPEVEDEARPDGWTKVAFGGVKSPVDLCPAHVHVVRALMVDGVLIATEDVRRAGSQWGHRIEEKRCQS